MRCLERNKRTFYYAESTGTTPVLDDDGFDTGEVEQVFTEPLEMRGNISPATGEVASLAFGESVQYDSVIAMDSNCPITERCVLWLDHPITEPYDYVIKKIARSINSVLIAVSRVQVDG